MCSLLLRIVSAGRCD
ncbi:hypothetical protein [Escherichia coli]|nr:MULTISPECIES: hypothetical protein [Enterobacteriaceae]MDK6514561.1 hypothetical protein [Klebsiella oxytoca]